MCQEQCLLSQCLEGANFTWPADPTPDLANPGGFCKYSWQGILNFSPTLLIGGESATERSDPTVCVPGYTCSGPGVYGFYVCLLGTSSSTSTAAISSTVAAAPTTLLTTVVSTATSSAQSGG